MMDEGHRAMLRTHGTLVARVLIGALFVWSAIGIVSGENGIANSTTYYAQLGIPFAALTIWLVLAVKLIAGTMLMLGYRVGWAAGALILFLLGTIFFAHLDPTDDNLTKNLAIVGGLLYVMAYGAGEGWSLKSTKKEAATNEGVTPSNPAATQGTPVSF